MPLFLPLVEVHPFLAISCFDVAAARMLSIYVDVRFVASITSRFFPRNRTPPRLDDPNDTLLFGSLFGFGFFFLSL